ncbi:protein translocase subunit SecF [Candidatus Peregrinibacteria bacterium]|nr:protein translocase subunit SecF [Candidatus Peregrinibacteria bacterium]
MKKYLGWKIIAILVLSLFLVFFDLPGETQKKILPFTPEAITKSSVNLGLDLQGGSQLDYKIDLRKVPEKEQESIINGVLGVIEKRVNRLGVAEPNIYVSNIAEETHIIVELAEIGEVSQEDVDNYLSSEKVLANLSDDELKSISLEKAKDTVGKTIQLEFKEEKKTLDPQEKDKVKENALAALERIQGGDSFSVVAQEEEQAYPGKVSYDTVDYTFESDLSEEVANAITSLEIDGITQELIETGGKFVIDQDGQAVEETGLSIIKLVDKKDELKSEKEVSVRHILIAWEGLDSAGPNTVRSEQEAYELAKEIRAKLTDTENPASFDELAKENSDDTSNAESGGVLEAPVTGDGTYLSEFEEAALALKKGDISEITKSNFGYHIIKADDVRSDVYETQYKYEILEFSTKPDPWVETGLTGEHFVHADVMIDYISPYVSIQFNDEGAALFEEITERNIGKRLAIFVGGEMVSAPTVDEKIAGGKAQITGKFTGDEAKSLARDLNTGAIPAPIILTGEYTIGASLGHEALNKSMMAGAIGMLIVMLFMILFYRIPGLIASAALIIYSSILIFLIKSSFHLGISLFLSLIIFIFLIMKIVNNKDSGWEKFLSFILSCVAFFFVTYLLKTGVVLTLAGIAGIILSIGMAVDANILIFERVKEELRDGKTLKAAVDNGFDRAWGAIRDSNFSTLITCAILFYFGSSIIRGFAFNLAAGVLVSMFSAVTITRTLLYGFVGKKIAENLKAFGVCEKRKTWNLNFIKKSRVWLGLSGVLIAISLVAMISFGLNLGIDFKGGSLMEFKFTEEVSKDQLTSTFADIEEEFNSSIPEYREELSAEGLEEEAADGETMNTITEEGITEKEATEENEAETGESILLAESTETEAESIVEESTDTEGLSLEADQFSQIDLKNIQILSSGENGYIVKTKYITSVSHDKIIELMKERLPEFTENRFTTIGPTIGKTLLHKALIAIIFTLIVIIIYIAMAFRKISREVSSWRFGGCAIAALVHDVIIVTGFFIILSQFFNVEIDALFVTAMLTVFGYSVNDTIVVFDRLRENLIKSKGESLKDNANKALNDTFTRSLNTSISTLIALTAVLLFGSSSIFFFILALVAGTIIGTYSSMFTASPLLVLWDKLAEKRGSE